jgi:hypothetical protein
VARHQRESCLATAESRHPSGAIRAANPHRTTADSGPAAYRAARDATCRAGHYLPVPQTWINRLGVRAALLLSRVLTTGQVHADEDGWVWLTPAYVEASLGFGAALQGTLLDILGDAGLVEVDGDDGQRRVRVNLERVRELIGKK